MTTELTLESASTLISVVMFLFFNWVLTSAKNRSPFLVPVDVITCSSKYKLLKSQAKNDTETRFECKNNQMDSKDQLSSMQLNLT